MGEKVKAACLVGCNLGRSSARLPVALPPSRSAHHQLSSCPVALLTSGTRCLLVWCPLLPLGHQHKSSAHLTAYYSGLVSVFLMTTFLQNLQLPPTSDPSRSCIGTSVCCKVWISSDPHKNSIVTGEYISCNRFL